MERTPRSVEEYNTQIKAAMSFWRMMPDGEAKKIARKSIVDLMHKKHELAKKERVHAEALIWNEACWFFTEK